MIQGLYNSAAASDGLQAWGDVIARNITASSIPGFKRDAFMFDGIALGSTSYGSNPAKPIHQPVIAPISREGINFEPGEMRRTGDPVEFAIEGKGFFRLQRPDGEFVYTRDGQFRVSAEGQLKSKQGYTVMGDSGPIQLLIDQGPFVIDPQGRVRQGDQEVGVLNVYEFSDVHSLHRTQGGFVVDPNRPQNPTTSETARVYQGFLESSNASPIREMVDLVTINNALQANQKVIQSIDGLLERAIQQLGVAG
jgi:flagellar basal body rod protein FlgG